MQDMQDTLTGKMVEIEEDTQAARDAAIPQRERHGPVFTVGEVLDIRGGKFQFHAISEKRIYLDSLPSK